MNEIAGYRSEDFKAELTEYFKIRPIRIQRKRIKGYNMQHESVEMNGLPAVSVCRPHKWGNPFKVNDEIDASECVNRFRINLLRGALAISVEDVVRELKGKNLACFCSLDSPCHADELLYIANNY